MVGIEGRRRVGDEIQEAMRNRNMKVIKGMLDFGLSGMGSHGGLGQRSAKVWGLLRMERC